MKTVTTTESQGRIEWLDIAKALGTLMVVYGHSHGPKNYYFYLFHMPLFFLLSGYLYHDKDSVLGYIAKKLKGLYIPFVSWNLIFMAVDYYSLYSRGLMTAELSKPRIENAILTIFTLGKNGEHLGATWFLGGLFSVSIIYKLLDTLVKKWKYRQAFLLIFFFLAMVGAFNFTLPYLQSRTVVLGFFFAFGRFLRVHERKIHRFNDMFLAFLVLVLFLIIGTKTRANMGTNEYNSHLLFITAALSGSFVTVCVSNWIAERKLAIFRPLKYLLKFIGLRSMDILIWQFVAFRFCVAFQFLLEWRPVLDAITSDNRYITDGAWWIFYFLTGVILPLLWGCFLRIGPHGWLLKKLHFVTP